MLNAIIFGVTRRAGHCLDASMLQEAVKGNNPAPFL
jgi:hypothetical protein